METLKQPAMMAAIGNLVLTSGLFVFLNNKIDALGTTSQTMGTKIETAEKFTLEIGKESEARHEVYKKQNKKLRTDRDQLLASMAERDKEIAYLREYVDAIGKALAEKDIVVEPPRKGKKVVKKTVKPVKKKKVESSSESESEQDASDPSDSESESDEEYIPKDMRKKKTRN